jgi:glyoxylase-like metal-dependent hydrolase (beta-lactamase superfamily II)
MQASKGAGRAFGQRVNPKEDRTMKTVKRILLVVGGLAIVAVLGFAGLVASAFWGNAPLPERADLPGGARLVKDGFVAAFVLPAGGSSVALIDCGNDPEAKPILAELWARHGRPDDVKAIFLTHGHGDHTAGCHQFPNAEVMALGADVALAAGTEKGRSLLARFGGSHPEKAVKVTRVVTDGETVTVGDLSVRVFAVPGHTDGSAAYLAGGVLYLGDSATDRKDGAFAGAPAQFSNDTAQNHASLRSLFRRLRDARLDVKMLAPSHSAPQSGTAAFEAFANASD